MTLDVRPDLLSRIMQRVHAKTYRTREEILRATALELAASGVERMRFYTLGQETIPESSHEPNLYLTWVHSSAGQADSLPALGHRIPVAESTMFAGTVGAPRRLTDDLHQPTWGSVSGLATVPEHPSWLKDLGMEGRSWVDVAVYDQRHLIGLIALDWLGPPSVGGENDVNEQSILALLGHLVGAHIAATAPQVEGELQKRIQALYARPRSGLEAEREDSLLRSAARIFQDEVGIASLSIFRYSWTDQMLRREDFSTLGEKGEYEVFKHSQTYNIARVAFKDRGEEFHAGEKLTGKAWLMPEYRRVLDFPALVREHPELVSSESLAFHSSVVGQVQSVMYGVLGTKERRYLLRFINNRVHPGLPFLSEYELLEQFVQDLGPAIDNRITEMRARAVRWAQEGVITRQSAKRVTHDVFRYLRAIEAIDRPVALAQQGDALPHFFEGVPEHEIRSVRSRLPSDKLYATAILRADGTLRGLRAADSVLFQLMPPETTAAVVAPFESGGTRGLLMFPLSNAEDPPHERIMSLSEETRAFLAQMASLIGQTIEQHFVVGQSEGALKALSLVGHEMATPLVAMSQLGLRCLKISRDVLEGKGTSFDDDIDEIDRRMRYHLDTLASAIQLGQLVGRQTEGRIVGVYQRHHLATVLNRAIERTRSELTQRTLLSPTSGLVFGRPVGQTSVRLALDATLIESALVNIYRNAVKYSIEQDDVARVQTNIEVGAVANRSFVDISITNVGIHIPEYHEELIFEAFSRYAEPIDDVTRRGMGLGLYLARQIARAHGGDAMLRAHHPVRSKTPGGQGYATTVTLRLRSDLPEGPYERRVRIGGKDE
jgi:signal transduction histidine kinase